MTYKVLASFQKYNWLCHLATFFHLKCGQVTKPIILVKICYGTIVRTYVIQGVKNIIFDKVTSWPQLISKILVTPPCFLIGLTLFVFCLAYYYFLEDVIGYYTVALDKMLVLPLSLSVYT